MRPSCMQLVHLIADQISISLGYFGNQLDAPLCVEGPARSQGLHTAQS